MNRIRLREDVSRAREMVRSQKLLDPDNEVALAMYGADLKRALKALSDHQEEPELRFLRGLVRGCPVELV